MNGIMHLMTEEKPEDRRKIIIIYNEILEQCPRYDGAITYIDGDDIRFDLDGEDSVILFVIILILFLLHIYLFFAYGKKPMEEVPLWVWWILKD